MMKNRLHLPFIFFLVASVASLCNEVWAQTPLLEWQKSLGGSADDHAYSIVRATDGSYVIAGGAISDDGDVTGHHPSNPFPAQDFWIVKIDSSGNNILWEKSYGGSDADVAKSIVSTSDNGFIVAGYSTSADGDVTGHHGSNSYDDYWVIKIDSAGNLQWEQSYGGAKSDLANAIIQTSDGNYLVVGESGSKDGDVTGHHGAINDADLWVVKLDTAGNILWEDSYGGTARDVASSVIETADGHYVIGGYVFSFDGDVTGHHGTLANADSWVIELDGNGQLLWQKAYGGSLFEYGALIAPTSDNGFIFTTPSTSVDGDASANYGSFDYWIVKTDGAGNILWQKNYGGSNDDEPFSIIKGLCNEYVVHGESVSNDIDVSGNHGSDYWTMAINFNSDLLWQKCTGGSSGELGTQIIKTGTGYVATGVSDSDDGNVTGHHGNTGYLQGDYWVIKLKDTMNIVALTPSVVQNVSCFNGTDGIAIAAAAGGTSPYNFEWNTTPAQFSDTVTNLTEGTYAVTVTDANGCVASEEITITQPSPLFANAGQDTLVCEKVDVPLGGNPTADGGTSGYSYSWEPAAYNIGNVSNPVIEADSTTIFVVTVTDANGCTSSDSITVTTTICTGNAAPSTSSSSITIYPNPLSTLTTISYEMVPSFHDAAIIIQDLHGKIISTHPLATIHEGKVMINATNLEDGIYFALLYGEGKLLSAEKLVVIR